MNEDRPFAQTLTRLRDAGLRPTRQRLALGRLLFDSGDRHVTAEVLHEEAQKAGVSVSLATVYNTLHQFTDAHLLREVVVDSARTYFDTNVSDHHHFFVETSGHLMDIDGDKIAVMGLPEAPEGTSFARVDVIVRLAGEPRR
ncbi:MAG: iron response transcriptional regulator IrrA [Parvibaculaceae bacterium]